MLRRLPKIITFGTIGTLGVVGVGLYFSNNSYKRQLLPVMHMVNVVNAGMKMAFVYKYSSKSTTDKHVQASGYLRQALKKNGGIYIKLGQLLATLDVIVPDQYRESMITLTRGCPISSFENVRAIIQQETGKPLQQTFSQFNQDPISSASIGQVHKAKLINGKEVAVKIQHENLSQNVGYDIQLMWMFVKVAKFIFKDDFKFQWLIQQFDVNIKKQLDFRLQAENMQRVKEMLTKQKFKNVRVPQLLLPAYKKMLVMEYIHGYHIDQIQKMKKANINMKEIGKTFSNVIIKMIHKYGFVHADPHSGNLLVRKDEKGKDELILLDHGLYQELNEKTRDNYNWFWLGLILNNEDLAVKAANSLGTSNGVLLCSMLTGQTRQQLKSPDRNIFDLNPSTDKAVVMKHAKEWSSQIIQLLNEINRSILLLLKVNQFARTIQNMMGGRQMGVYHDIAGACVDSLPISYGQKLKYKWSMFNAYFWRK